MFNDIVELNLKLAKLSVFRSILDTDVIKDLKDFTASTFDYETFREADLDVYYLEEITEALNSYGKFVSTLYKNGGDMGTFVEDYIKGGDSFYFDALNSGKMDEEMRAAGEFDQGVLQSLSQLTPETLLGALKGIFPGDYPLWKNKSVDVKALVREISSDYERKGFGAFRNHSMFKVKDEKLIPIDNPDVIQIDSLYEYERERNLVLKNTRAFASGESASNVLLYGDAGTGKSTTVKSVASSLFQDGIRLVEFNKNQVGEIPAVAESLFGNPLKFIFFIDDLTFAENDSDYYALKGILEGTVSGTGNNVLVYATSNRRHLIKESMADRQGDDLHINDTLQETMSLSARFGLTITFMKPEKDTYLSIVESMAREQGLSMDGDELFTKAEAFAIRMNGRSPRTAKQFIIQLKNGLI